MTDILLIETAIRDKIMLIRTEKFLWE